MSPEDGRTGSRIIAVQCAPTPMTCRPIGTTGSVIMNRLHLEFCASDDWAQTVREHIVPGATRDIDLGDHLLEVGPGPGRTTEVLAKLVPRLTAVELDPDLAAQLCERFAGSNITVVEADATEMPLEDNAYSSAICLTMLHHVPTAARQDRLFAEVRRVLKPGGVFVGSDSLDSQEFRGFHEDDICNPVDPATLAGRLEAAGFREVQVSTNPFACPFVARA